MKKRKEQAFTTDEGLQVKFLPNSEGGLKNAYIRFGDADNNYNYFGSIDKKAHLRKLRDWCDLMLKGDND